MSNLKLKRLISLILCGTFMNCSISYAMDSDSSSLSSWSDDSSDEQPRENNQDKIKSAINKNDDKSDNKFENKEQSQKQSLKKEQTEKDGDLNYEGDDESDSDEFSKKGKERSREQSLEKDKQKVKSEYSKNNKDYAFLNKYKKKPRFNSNSKPTNLEINVKLTIKYADFEGIRESYECKSLTISDSVSKGFLNAFGWANAQTSRIYRSTDQNQDEKNVYIWLSKILENLKNPKLKLILDRELPKVQTALINSIKQELGDTNLIQSISVSGGKSGKLSKYQKNDPNDLYLILTCKTKYPDCKIYDGCVFPIIYKHGDTHHMVNHTQYAYTIEALSERTKCSEINNPAFQKSHYGDALGDLIDLQGYASEEDNLPNIPDNIIKNMKNWVEFHNNNWSKKEGLLSILDMEKALKAIKWLCQLTSKNYENDNRIGSIYFKAINNVLDYNHKSVNVKTPFGITIEVVASDKNNPTNTGLYNSSGLLRGIAREIINRMPFNRQKKGMEIMKNLLDSKASPDFLKYDEDQNLIYYDYPGYFSIAVNNAGFTDNECKALGQLFLNLVYFYPRRLKENGKLGRAHIERAYKILHNIK